MIVLPNAQCSNEVQEYLNKYICCLVSIHWAVKKGSLEMLMSDAKLSSTFSFLVSCLFLFFHESQLHMHSSGAITFIKKKKIWDRVYSYVTYFSAESHQSAFWNPKRFSHVGYCTYDKPCFHWISGKLDFWKLCTYRSCGPFLFCHGHQIPNS